MARPQKAPEDRLVTLSVRVPRASVEMLERIVEGERAYLARRKVPLTGVSKSAAFRTIWDLGEQEYLLQRATLWITRKVNRYTIEQAAELIGWDSQALRKALADRGVRPEPGPAGPAPPL